MEPKSPSKSKIQITGLSYKPRSRQFVIITLSIILILGVIGGYLFFKDRFFLSENMSTYFTVVLDCGSTGSRVNVYEWMIRNGSKVYGTLPLLLRIYPDNANKSNGCRYAEQRVPLEKRASTPIFVLATAGMRRLVAKNANRVLAEVENVVKEHGFLYNKNWIRVLSGKEEAYYGWVALNYKTGVLESSSKKIPTLGLLDLGGSSLQVVAEMDASTKDKHALRSKIGTFEHDIVAYSLPAFGLNEAFDRTIVMLSRTRAKRESVGGVFEIRHPCLGSGFVKNYTFVVSRNSSNRVHEEKNELNPVFLVGEPNWEKCGIIARAAAINSSNSESSHQLYNSNCIGLFSYGGNKKLNLTKNLHAVSRYHALSGFFAVYNALNLSRRANLTTMWEMGQNLCSGQKRINGQDCFRLPYLISLIENALCLSDVEIIFGPGDITWTLGASLIETEFLWLHSGKSRNGVLFLKDSITVIPSTLVTFVLLLFLMIIVYSCQVKLPMLGRKNVVAKTSYFCPKCQPN
ncbi:hypothetical protein MIMGU_mgv1a004670mg [Erythranthe guttata]|uniref:Apyrase n=1 Tax=Erythranthe guttata TaxID=4155 RepID=A0A022Q3C7_ERYGU|nr:hypothetical protein MIMGU_mgv1a004670mg [Erythranthe guttata]